MIDFKDVARVVAVRRGRFRAADFGLRPGETGLSVFACDDEATAERILNAVRSAGKMGELVVAALTVEQIRSLGLELIPSLGQTPDEVVNELHLEARLTRETLDFARRLGQDSIEFFNQQLASALSERARIIFPRGPRNE